MKSEAQIARNVERAWRGDSGPPDDDEWPDLPPPTLEQFGLPTDAERLMDISVPPDLSHVVLSIDDWLSRDLPEPDCLMGKWLTTTSRVLFVAETQPRAAPPKSTPSANSISSKSPEAISRG
jgi:hypothetical protein